MNKLRAQLRAHKWITATMGLALVASFGLVGVKAFQGTAQTVCENGATCINNEATQPVSDNLGASPGPDRYADSFSDNGVRVYPYSQGYTTATNTPCAIKSPSATSTLTFGSASFTTSTSVASTVTLAKATSFNATTTILTEQSIVANGQRTTVASSTTAQGSEDKIFAPNQYFVVGMRGGTTSDGIHKYSPVGTCQAVFTVTN